MLPMITQAMAKDLARPRSTRVREIRWEELREVRASQPRTEEREGGLCKPSLLSPFLEIDNNHINHFVHRRACWRPAAASAV
jgi:hypothetical protein